MVFEIILGFVALLLAIGGLAILNRFSASSSVGGSSESSGLSLSFSEEASIAGTIQGALMEYMSSLYSEKDPTNILYKAGNLKKLFEKYAPTTKKLLEKMESRIGEHVKTYERLKDSLLRTYSGVEDITRHIYAGKMGAIPIEDAAKKIRKVVRYHVDGEQVAEDIADTEEKINAAKQLTREAGVQTPTEEQTAP